MQIVIPLTLFLLSILALIGAVRLVRQGKAIRSLQAQVSELENGVSRFVRKKG